MADEFKKEDRTIITLNLSGEPSIPDVAKAISQFYSLLNELRKEVAPQRRVDWELEDISRSSFRISARGIPARDVDRSAVDMVKKEYENIGRRLQSGKKLDYSDSVMKPVRKLTGILNGKVPTLRIETEENDFFVSGQLLEPEEKQKSDKHEDVANACWGAVTGKIQVLSRVRQLNFTLYDIRDNTPIYCYLTAGNEKRMKAFWGKIATVYGLVRRDPVTFRPATVRKIDPEKIQVHDKEVNVWDLVGGLPRKRKKGESPEEIIRRIRDAE